MSLYSIIIGLGKSGFSCVEFLAKKHAHMLVLDTRETPPYIHQFKEQFSNIPVALGPLELKWLENAKEIIVSPGLATDQPFFLEATKQGIPIIGDIELFAREVTKPVCGITGSNGKSTVTSLVYEMAKTAHINVACGGNIGTPALELITQPEPDMYVLELSSFQLEITHSLKLKAAAFLNLNPNHLDRYSNMEAYRQAKQRIYLHADTAICNKDDDATFPEHSMPCNKEIYFSLSKPGEGEFGLLQKQGEYYLALGETELMPISHLKIKGMHNQYNALAALAIGYAMNIPMEAMLNTLMTFPGLMHRCQYIGAWNGVEWFNDSKATNVTATLAAVEGLGSSLSGKLVLLLGGQDKGDDFTRLTQAVKKYVRSIIVFGQDASLIEKALKSCVPLYNAQDFQHAVELSQQHAQAGDAVLLSPACASYDMFDNFEHRGSEFIRLVQEIVAI